MEFTKDASHLNSSEFSSSNVEIQPEKPMNIPDTNIPPGFISGSNESNLEKLLKRKREPWSDVWNHFFKFNRDDGKQRARCNYCGKDYAADPNIHGTSTLSSHLKRCKKYACSSETQQTKLAYQQSIIASIEGSKVGAVKIWKFDQEETRKALAHMIIVDEQPFSMVEREGFKYFCEVACPNFVIPSRSTITRDCYGLYMDIKTKLKNFLKLSCQRISLTTDTWTSEQRINYMCLTAHFIDNDWKLHKKVLNFCPISSHKGEAIGKAIEKCLIEWGIDRVFTLTVDNASSNDTAIAYVKKRLINWGTSILGCKYIHVRCVAHIINLVVSDGLREIGGSISHVRAAVRYIRQSPARLQKFKQCAEMEKCETKKLLCLDVPTRWNSTYLMLDTAEKFEKVFERYDEQDPHFRIDLEQHDEGVPTEEDWIVVRRFILFLRRFYHLTLRVSGSLYVTSNLVFNEISNAYALLKQYEQNGEPDLREMANKMKKEYDKYWGSTEKINLLIYIAAILDPRTKFEYVDFVLEDMYGRDANMSKLVKDALYELFTEYNRLNNHNQSSNSDSASFLPCEIDASSTKGMENDQIYWSLYKKRCGSESENPYAELERYLTEMKQEPKPDFSILTWWKENGSRFPILSQIARDILAVPVSTVASECTFSMGGRVLDTFRSSLTPKIAQALMCSRDWIRTSGTPISVEEDLEDLDTLEKDLSKVSFDTAINSN